MPPTAAASQSEKSRAAREHHVPKPDEVAHKKAIEETQGKINGLRMKFDAVKEKIANTTSKGSINDQRAELREKLNKLRLEQAELKQSRESIFQQMNQIDASKKKKMQDIKAQRDKLPFKTVADIDRQIKELEAKVDSGLLKLLEEKKMLSEVSQLKRQRKIVESFESTEDSISVDKKAYDELKRTIDDSTPRAKSNEYNEVKKQLDLLSESQNADRDSRQKLFDERNDLQQQLEEQYTVLRTLREDFKKANDEWYTATRAIREKKREEQKREHEAYQAAKREERAQQEREAAERPAFEDEIKTCYTLIRLLSNLIGKPVSEELAEKKESNLNVRQVDSSNTPDGVALTRKADRDEEAYYTPKKSKKPNSPATTPSKQSLKFELTTLEAFWSIKVDIPTTLADIDKTIEKIEAMRADWVKRSPEVTAENIKKAQKKIDDILAGKEVKEAKKTDEELVVVEEAEGW